MVAKFKIQQFISALIFITINVLFYFKYMYRIAPEIGVVGVCCYLVFLFFLYLYYNKRKLSVPLSLSVGTIGLYIVSCIVILFFIPKETLIADRWVMIDLFWDSTSNGLYPYGVPSVSGNYPGPMPFYFILSYPFYLVGEIGYMTIAAVLIWLVYSYKMYDKNTFGLLTLLLFSSLAVNYEIFARSTIFFNSCLFGLFFFTLKDLGKKLGSSFYLSAIAGGLLFSTRNVFAIPLLMWGVYALHRKQISFVRLLQWSSIFLLSFIISFLPFVLIDPLGFVKMNPFIIQGTFLLPFSYILAFIIISIFVSLLCKSFENVVFCSGLILFCIITAHVWYAIYRDGIEAYLFTSADISYYIFCFPFLLVTLVNQHNNDKK